MKTQFSQPLLQSAKQIPAWRKAGAASKKHSGAMVESLEARAMFSVSMHTLTPSIPIPPPVQSPGIIAILIGL